MAETTERKQASEIAALWAEKQGQFSNRDKRISRVRDWLGKRVRPTVPEDFQAAVDMAVVLPTPITVTSHTVQLLSRKRPFLKRPVFGKGNAPQKRSTRIENFVNAACQEIEAQGGPVWRPWMEGLFSHGEGALLCYPAMAHWEQFPEFNADEPAAMFQRDSKDRDPEDEWFTEPGKKRSFSLDGKRTEQAFKDYTADFKATRIPLVVRFIPADQCIPIFGPNFRLDGLLVRSEYTEDSLTEKGYSWTGGDGHPGPGTVEGQNSGGSGRTFTLYELHTRGKVCYWVGTAPTMLTEGKQMPTKPTLYETTKKGTDGTSGPAEVDLAAEFGVKNLHAYYGYGAHWAAEGNPDHRGIPFLYPLDEALHAANSFTTAKIINAWNRAFGQDYVEVNKDVPEGVVIDEDGHPRKIPRQPNITTYVGGKVVHGYDTSAGNDVDEIMGLLLGTVDENSPSKANFGGEGASSGHDRSLIRSFLQDAYHDVLEGGRLGWEWLGQMTLEWCTAIARTQSHAVAVYGSANEDGGQREHLELPADLCGDLWDLKAYYQQEMGENLPLTQTLMEYAANEQVPLRFALEKGLGVENPEDMQVEIMVERLLKTPQGESLTLSYAASEIQDEALKKLSEAILAGEATQDGSPTAALAGMEHLTGTSMAGTTAQSQVAGIVGGAMGTQNINRDATAAMAA